MILRDAVFHPSLFSWRPTIGSAFPLNHDHIYYFAYSRFSFYQGFKLLGLQKPDAILIPEYICHMAVLPARYLGLEIVYYKINVDLSPDWDDIRRKLNSRVKAFLIVNYFGFPNDLLIAQQFCKTNGLFFIEDNAHGFLSSFGDRPLGSFGDISVFSFYKTLPMPNGSALVINDKKILSKLPMVKLKNEGRDIKFFVKMMLMRLRSVLPRNRLSSAKRYWKNIEKSHLSAYNNEDLERYFLRISWLSRLLLKHFLPLEEIQRRLQNYESWLKFFDNYSTARILFPQLKQGVVPYVFPVWADSPRDLILDLHRRGVESYPWPFLPKDSPEEYLSKHMVCLPVTS